MIIKIDKKLIENNLFYSDNPTFIHHGKEWEINDKDI